MKNQNIITRHVPEDQMIRSARIVKIGDGGSFFRDFRTSLGGPLSFHLSPSRGLTTFCIILPAGVPVGIVWSPAELLYPPWPPSRCIYYPGIFRHTHIHRARTRRDAKEEFSLYLSRSHSPLLSPVNLSLRSLLFSRLYLFVEAKENKTEECVLHRGAERCRGPH